MSNLSKIGVILFTSEMTQGKIYGLVFQRKSYYKQLGITEIENIRLQINMFLPHVGDEITCVSWLALLWGYSHFKTRSLQVWHATWNAYPKSRFFLFLIKTPEGPSLNTNMSPGRTDSWIPRIVIKNTSWEDENVTTSARERNFVRQCGG